MGGSPNEEIKDYAEGEAAPAETPAATVTESTETPAEAPAQEATETQQ